MTYEVFKKAEKIDSQIRYLKGMVEDCFQNGNSAVLSGYESTHMHPHDFRYSDETRAWWKEQMQYLKDCTESKIGELEKELADL